MNHKWRYLKMLEEKGSSPTIELRKLKVQAMARAGFGIESIMKDIPGIPLEMIYKYIRGEEIYNDRPEYTLDRAKPEYRRDTSEPEYTRDKVRID